MQQADSFVLSIRIKHAYHVPQPDFVDTHKRHLVTIDRDCHVGSITNRQIYRHTR